MKRMTINRLKVFATFRSTKEVETTNELSSLSTFGSIAKIIHSERDGLFSSLFGLLKGPCESNNEGVIDGFYSGILLWHTSSCARYELSQS